MEDTLYRCTVCGRVGTVGRCCGDETREPLNDLARQEQEKIKAQNLEKPDAYSLLAEVQAVLGDIVDDNYRIFEPDSMDINRSLHKQINELYKKISEHFS